MDESLTLMGFTTGFGPSVMPEMFIEDDKAATAAAHCVDPLRLFGVGVNFARDPVSTPPMVVFLIGDCVCCLHHIYEKIIILINFTIYIHASPLPLVNVAPTEWKSFSGKNLLVPVDVKTTMTNKESYTK